MSCRRTYALLVWSVTTFVTDLRNAYTRSRKQPLAERTHRLDEQRCQEAGYIT
jgi:hypothetical protein